MKINCSSILGKKLNKTTLPTTLRFALYATLSVVGSMLDFKYRIVVSQFPINNSFNKEDKMYRKIAVLVLVTLTFSLWGCGNKLTEETAKQVIEKEILSHKNKRDFTKISFAKGSKGFDYFQKLIADGTFQFKGEKKAPLGILSKETTIVKTYAPKPELANVFNKLEIKDELVRGNFSFSAMIDFDAKKTLPRRTVCKTFAKIKKEAVKSIDGIFNDGKKGTAVVKYTVEEVGVTPYYSDLCSFMPDNLDCSLRKPYSTEIQLKKYEEGWNIDMNPY